MRFTILAALFAVLVNTGPAGATRCMFEGEEDNNRIFADVPASHPMCKEIESLYRDGMTNGCGVEGGELYFCPDEPLTRAAGAAFAEHRDPFAQVDRDGRIRISDHVLDSGYYEQGIYWIQFTRNIAPGCSMEGWSHDWRGPGVRVDVTLLWGTADTVLVETYVSGHPTDMWFNVRIHCR